MFAQIKILKKYETIWKNWEKESKTQENQQKFIKKYNEDPQLKSLNQKIQ